MRTHYHPHAKFLVVIPCYGQYDIVKMCVEHLEKNTTNTLYYVMVNDGYPEPLPFEATAERTIIDFKNEPPQWEHKEHIVGAMDLGLDYARRNVAFDYFVKLETDVLVQPDWENKLLEVADKLYKQGINWATLEGVYVDLAPDDPEDYVQEQIKKATEGQPRHYEVEYNQMNCSLFSPALMQKPWWFSMVTDHHDVLLSRNFISMGGNMKNIETKDVWHKHYRGTSRAEMDRLNKEKGF